MLLSDVMQVPPPLQLPCCSLLACQGVLQGVPGDADDADISVSAQWTAACKGSARSVDVHQSYAP